MKKEEKMMMWKLPNLPNASDVAMLVDKGVIEPKEARQMLFTEKELRKVDLGSRKFLWKLQDEAEKLSRVDGTNHEWVDVYKDLAKAAGTLDAFIARSSMPLTPIQE